MKKQDVDNMTLQEAVDYAMFKIVEQGGRCRSLQGLCAYGNAEGKHCAVGWLLDEDNQELMGFNGGVYNLVMTVKKGAITRTYYSKRSYFY